MKSSTDMNEEEYNATHFFSNSADYSTTPPLSLLPLFPLFFSLSLSLSLVHMHSLTQATVITNPDDAVISCRSLAKGYEAFRTGYPGLVHYYHTKTGMWKC